MQNTAESNFFTCEYQTPMHWILDRKLCHSMGCLLGSLLFENSLMLGKWARPLDNYSNIHAIHLGSFLALFCD